MRRREFIVLLGAAAAWPLSARAQRTGRLLTIGFLGSATPAVWAPSHRTSQALGLRQFQSGITAGICDRRNGVPGSACTTAILSRSCPLWVKSGHRGELKGCPLYPRKRTLELGREMSAKCQKQTFCDAVKIVVIRSPGRRGLAAVRAASAQGLRRSSD